MDITEEKFEVTKIMNNLKQHNFQIQDYKICESEAKVIIDVLEKRLVGLETINILESAT